MNRTAQTLQQQLALLGRAIHFGIGVA